MFTDFSCELLEQSQSCGVDPWRSGHLGTSHMGSLFSEVTLGRSLFSQRTGSLTFIPVVVLCAFRAFLELGHMVV